MEFPVITGWRHDVLLIAL